MWGDGDSCIPYACPLVLVVLLVVTDFAELECFE
jgi:hypothetical protein